MRWHSRENGFTYKRNIRMKLHMVTGILPLYASGENRLTVRRHAMPD